MVFPSLDLDPDPAHDLCPYRDRDHVPEIQSEWQECLRRPNQP